MLETNQPIKKFRKLRNQSGEYILNIPSEIVYRLDLKERQECCIIAHKDKLACELWFKPPKKEETEIKDNESE